MTYPHPEGWHKNDLYTRPEPRGPYYVPPKPRRPRQPQPLEGTRDDYEIRVTWGWAIWWGLFSWTALITRKDTGEPVKKIVRPGPKMAWRDAQHWLDYELAGRPQRW